MKALVFASRNRREMLRDPLNMAFGIGFPVIILLLLSAIQANVPVEIFTIDKLISGIAVFGLSFISLFSGMLIAKDRSTSFLMRLFAAPLTSSDYIMGYTLPLIPLSVMQIAISFGVAFLLGLPVSVNVLVAIITLFPSAILFIGIGLLAGSILSDRQVGGVCGALLTNLSAWLSGTWFDLNLVGGWFKRLAYALPFAHAVDAGRYAITGHYSQIMPDLWWVIGYAAAVMIIAVFAFRKKMNGEA